MKNIPNAISFFRILLIPFFIIRIVEGDTLSAAVILIVSGVTDMLDGMIARAMNWITPLGKVLDPVADKLTQMVVYVALIMRFREYWGIFAFMIFKDLAMLVMTGFLMRRGVKIEGARWFGKLATIVFYFTAVLIFLFPGLPDGIILGLLILTFACVLLSAALYIPEFLCYNRKRGKGD
jgi:cardiolipin synthase